MAARSRHVDENAIPHCCEMHTQTHRWQLSKMNGHDLSLSRALAMQLYLLLLNILESSAPRRTIKMPIKLNESFYTIKYVRLYVISVEWRTVAVAVATAMTAFPAHKQRVVRGRRRIEYTDVLAMSLQ